MSLNSNALITVAEAKAFLGMASSITSEDPILELFINSASERVASYCDRVFVSDTYTEFHSGRLQNFLLPNQFPVTSIAQMRISSSHDWTDPAGLVDATSYRIADFDSTIQYDGLFPKGYNNIRMVYDAGFTIIPSDLKLACMWFFEWFYRHRQRQDMGRSNVSKGDESITILSKMPDMIKEILVDYKRCEFNNTASSVRNA